MVQPYSSSDSYGYRRIRRWFWYCSEIKSRKAAGLYEILSEEWKIRKFDDILLRLCNAVYQRHIMEKWPKSCILPFEKKGDLGIAKNYKGISLTAIAAEMYNGFLFNVKFRNRSTTSSILTIHGIIEGVQTQALKNIHMTKTHLCTQARKYVSILTFIHKYILKYTMSHPHIQRHLLPTIRT